MNAFFSNYFLPKHGSSLESIYRSHYLTVPVPALRVNPCAFLWWSFATGIKSRHLSWRTSTSVMKKCTTLFKNGNFRMASNVNLIEKIFVRYQGKNVTPSQSESILSVFNRSEIRRRGFAMSAMGGGKVEGDSIESVYEAANRDANGAVASNSTWVKRRQFAAASIQRPRKKSLRSSIPHPSCKAN